MRQKEIGMNKVKATHLAGVALVSLLALGVQQVAQAEPMDHHSGAMHGHYARHGHYGAMHDRSAMGGHYGAMHGRYAMGGYHGYGARHGRYAMGGYHGYGPRYGRYAVGGGIAAAAIPPQGYGEFMGSYQGSYPPPQPSYGGQGLGFFGSQPVYVLPNGMLTSSLSDYYNYRGPSYGYGGGLGPVGGPVEGVANATGATLDAATLGIFGPTNTGYAPPPAAAPPPPAAQHMEPGPGYGQPPTMGY
jgi:hypothetical protein